MRNVVRDCVPCSELLELLDHLRVLVPFDHGRPGVLAIEVLLHEGNDDILVDLLRLVALRLELEQAGEVLNLLIHHARLRVEHIAVAQAAVLVVDDSDATHDGDLARVDARNGCKPSAHNGFAGGDNGEARASSWPASVLELLNRADWFLVLVLAEEDVDSAVHGAS